MKENVVMNKVKFFVLMIALIIVDQITKIMVLSNMSKFPLKIINGLLDFTYCENRGIAFGFASGHVRVVSIVTIVILIAVTIVVCKNFRKMNSWASAGAAMMLAGGFGNFIDRAFRAYVVDFIDVSNFIEFPIFNFADICVVVGVFVVGLSIIVDCRREKLEGNKS